MTRSLFAALILATSSIFISSVHAQEITAAERSACTVDYDKYCKGTFPGGGRIIKCLASHYESLGGACKKVVDANKK